MAMGIHLFQSLERAKNLRLSGHPRILPGFPWAVPYPKMEKHYVHNSLH